MLPQRGRFHRVGQRADTAAESGGSETARQVSDLAAKPGDLN